MGWMDEVWVGRRLVWVGGRVNERRLTPSSCVLQEEEEEEEDEEEMSSLSPPPRPDVTWEEYISAPVGE